MFVDAVASALNGQTSSFLRPNTSGYLIITTCRILGRLKHRLSRACQALLHLRDVRGRAVVNSYTSPQGEGPDVAAGSKDILRQGYDPVEKACH